MLRSIKSFRSFALAGGFSVLIVALLALASLWVLSNVQRQNVYKYAAQNVLKQGELITRFLAEQSKESKDWSDFESIFKALRTLNTNLEYISVSVDGAILFHKQAEEILVDNYRDSAQDSISSVDIKLSRKLIENKGKKIPIVVFNTELAGEILQSARLEVGLRREAVDYEEISTLRAINRMFAISAITTAVSFVFCAIMIVLMMRREQRREALRRREEHLSFSGIMANGIAHDFRNPMNSARLDAQLLERETAREDYRLDRIRNIAIRIRTTLDRMDNILKEFLYLSRPVGAVEELELKTMLDGCVEMLKARMESQNIKVEKQYPDYPVRIKNIEGPLRRAVVNILNNAINVMPKGGIIKIQLTANPKGIVLDISDTGPGIPEAIRKKIFDLFFTTKPEGTGIGLFIAKTAIENCGGSIELIDGSEIVGACFRIKLPDLETGLTYKKDRHL